MSERKIVLVRRKSRLDELIVRFNTIEQAKFYIEHLGADFGDYLREHERYNIVIAQASESLSLFGRLQVVDRQFLPNFIFGRDDIVVAVGQDGLVANTLKYLDGQPVIGINPEPERWEGILLPFTVKDLPAVMSGVLKGARPLQDVSMAQVALNDGQKLYAVNDFFIGQKTHVSARYEIKLGPQREQQSSSGVIVSTGLGATGWFKSVLAGAAGIVNKAGGQKIKIDADKNFTWNANYLYFSVREPFPTKSTGTNLVFGKITGKNALVITSQMPENGVIFSDGIESDYLEFRSGMQAVITLADKKGKMVR